jgi:hypothetical protein
MYIKIHLHVKQNTGYRLKIVFIQDRFTLPLIQYFLDMEGCVSYTSDR